MNSVKSAAATQESVREYTNLDGLYGKIGISAVVAAVRYQSEPRNPAYAPVYPHNDD